MSEGGERTCPLCAEEMDLTDQHLKPCKCGYQICVWCWHHIIEMAEKDETEGRCPACRSPYDKEKIVGMTVKSERLAAEVNMERKKSQKAKPKPSEGRKQLSSVRVIQRNLVYIVGLPLDLADEDLLQRKEYFGQYGKVLKVSMSRTAAGVVQQFPNNTCSVYITYSKEEEAIRCIQAVHGFVLDGRSLKACFGTTKYCHAWLRKVPCTNPDCLYLHEVGSQEDSFTKDEIISAYMRSKVQQITGVTNSLQRRAGSMLPPPMDDYGNNSSSTKPIPKVALNNTQSILKSSPPNGSTGKAVTLPAGASWGMRSSSQAPVPISGCLNEPLKEKPGGLSVAANAPQMLISHSDVLKKPALEDFQTSHGNGTNSIQMSASHSDVSKKPALEGNRTSHGNAKHELSTPLKQQALLNVQTELPEKPSVLGRTRSSNKGALVSATVDDSRVVSEPSNCTEFLEHTSQSCSSMPSDGNKEANGRMQNLTSQVTSMTADKGVVDDQHGLTRSDSSSFYHSSINSPCVEVSQQHYAEEKREVLALQNSGRLDTLARAGVDIGADVVFPLVAGAGPVIDDDILSFNRQRLKDPEVVSCSADMAHSASLMHVANHMQSFSNGSVFVPSSFDGIGNDTSRISHGYIDKPLVRASGVNGSRLEHSNWFPDNGRETKPIGNRFLESQGKSSSTIDDSIIANILSLDLDESLTSPHNLAKLLGAREEETKSLKLSNSCKVQNNQSRFSFARQEESKDQSFESCSIFNQMSHGYGFYQDSADRWDPQIEKLGMYSGLSSSYLKGFDSITEHTALSSSALSRTPVSAPPGFSVPSRSPPPGFSSNGRMGRTFGGVSGNRFFETTLPGNSYQSPPVENIGGVGDIELMDPAILAVGQGRFQAGSENASLDLRSSFPGNVSTFENGAKLQQLLMQNPLSSHQNFRFPGHADGNLSLSNPLGTPSRLTDQSQGSSLASPFVQLSLQQSRNMLWSNGHYEYGWTNSIQGGKRLDMADHLRNESLGFNKLYGNYESSALQMPSSGEATASYSNHGKERLPEGPSLPT
ncbi:PREDICTED: uncharacterized protein LOC104826353 isoform X2 [Tarenaya hassleriana]|uniref:uncharacterized protein LOC104826353 isoform X2 n=1 Tax=Tarenaya hassleriana TaxID=28532 RepID=UPI00053C70B0|nr:PREDICTED: uncharacterized protein LOC104826353 isoform X2 [Tarenaya hassleriana]